MTDEVTNISANATLKMKVVTGWILFLFSPDLAISPVIFKTDVNPFGKIGLLANVIDDSLAGKSGVRENLMVSLKSNSSPLFAWSKFCRSSTLVRPTLTLGKSRGGDANFFDGVFGFTPNEFLFLNFVIPEDFSFEMFRQGVYDRNADTVETARNLVTAAAELGASMKFG